MSFWLKLTGRLAFSRDRQHLWRLGVVMLTSAVVACWWVLVVGDARAALGATAAAADRRPMVTVVEGGQKPQPDATLLALRGLVWRGQQVPVLWIDSASPEPVLPKGLRSLPAPGEAVISPGLADSGFVDDPVGFRIGRAGSGRGGVIGRDGVATESELLIYARPPEDRPLENDGTTYQMHRVGGPASAQVVADPTRQPWPLAIETGDPAPPARRTALVGGLLDLLPGIVLLALAGTALSATRDRRVHLLRRLGLTKGACRVLCALETGLLAGAGAGVGAVIGLVLTRTWAGLPGTGLRFGQGQMVVGVGSLVLVVVVVALTAAWAGTRLREGRGRGSRGGGAGGRIRLRPLRRAVGMTHSPWPTRMLAAGILTMLMSGPLRAPGALFLGLTISAVALVTCQPQVTSWIASWIPQRRPAAWLAVHRLAGNPQGLSRPAGATAALMLLAVGGGAVQAQMVAPISGGEVNGQTTADLTWRSPRPDDISLLRRGGPGVRIDPVGEESGHVTLVGSARAVRGVETVANSHLSAPNLFDGRRTVQRPDMRWLVPHLVWALAALTGAALVAVGNRVLSLVDDDVAILRAGLATDDIRAVQRAELAVSLGGGVALGAVTAAVFVVAGDLLQVAQASLWALGAATACVFGASIVTVAAGHLSSQAIDDVRR